MIQDNKELVGEVDLDEIVKRTSKEGWEIYNRKGTTYYGIATACVGIIKAILYDENRIIPVSTLLEGEYGQKEVFAGVPTILNRTGAADVLEIHMTEDELKRFQSSTSLIREYSNKIMQYC